MAEASSPTATRTNTTSRTVTDTIVGEHTHTIVGYSLIKGIGDGEPIASDRFTVGGHEWVLLFYPDGKRSSSSEPHLGDGANGNVINVGQALGQGQQLLLPAGPANAPAPALPAPPAPGPPAGAPAAAAHPPLFVAPDARAANEAGHGHGANAAGPGPGAPPQPGNAAAGAGPGQALMLHHHGAGQQQAVQAAAVHPPAAQAQRPQRRDTTNEYAALFVALIGEGPNPQGVLNTSEGKVVRAFHRFTLVDQANQQRDLTKGRTRDAGAVKISCARQDPNARNCHGYRKFVKRNILEDPSRGFLLNDTIVIKYTIELVVSSGGALQRATGAAPSKAELIKVPPPCLGKELGELLLSGNGSDYTIVVGDENIAVHRVILEARSPFFAGMLRNNMSEAQEGRFVIKDMVLPVVKAVLHFIYTDSLPEDMEGPLLEVPMAQHLLVAADLYQLTRLRRICERRLCETVDVETAATTLALAEQNHAEELKRVCLDFVARNLAAVMNTDGYRHMTRSCPALQAELLSVIAVTAGAEARPAHAHRSGHVRVREQNAADAPDEARRVRQRRAEP